MPRQQDSCGSNDGIGFQSRRRTESVVQKGKGRELNVTRLLAEVQKLFQASRERARGRSGSRSWTTTRRRSAHNEGTHLADALLGARQSRHGERHEGVHSFGMQGDVAACRARVQGPRRPRTQVEDGCPDAHHARNGGVRTSRSFTTLPRGRRFLNSRAVSSTRMTNSGWSAPAKPGGVVRFKQSVYGLSDTPFDWNAKHVQGVKEIGFQQSQVHPRTPLLQG